MTQKAKPPAISWKEWLEFLSPGGQQQLVDFVVRARETRGSAWLPAIKQEFPLFSWIADLACNKTDDEAVAEIADLYPGLPIRMLAGQQIKNLHARLKHEIEVKR